MVRPYAREAEAAAVIDWLYERALDFEWHTGVPLAAVIALLSIAISVAAFLVVVLT